MGIDTEDGAVFFCHEGRTIHHLEKHQDIAMEFHYLDTETGREFDVRDMPAMYVGEDRDAMLRGDRDAHQRIITRAIDDDYHFVTRPFKT